MDSISQPRTWRQFSPEHLLATTILVNTDATQRRFQVPLPHDAGTVVAFTANVGSLQCPVRGATFMTEVPFWHIFVKLMHFHLQHGFFVRGAHSITAPSTRMALRWKHFCTR